MQNWPLFCWTSKEPCLKYVSFYCFNHKAEEVVVTVILTLKRLNCFGEIMSVMLQKGSMELRRISL